DPAGLEVIGVRLEFLADGVALALDRLAVSWIDPTELEQAGFELLHRGLAGVEVAGLARAKIGVAVGVGDRRGAAILVDQRDQQGAQVGREKVRSVEKLGAG